MAGEDNKKSLANYFLGLIIISVVTLCLIVYVAIQISGEKSLTRETFKETRGLIIGNSTDLLLFPNDYILQYFQVNHTERKTEYHFCYDLIIVSNIGADLRVINEENETLANVYLSNGLQSQCSYLDRTKIKRENYIGFQCLNCNNNTVIVYPQEEQGGTNVIRVYETNGEKKIYEEQTLSYSLISYNNYYGFLKYLSITYLLVNVLTGLILLILYGFTKLEVLFDYEE